jgi:hypothetical protein
VTLAQRIRRGFHRIGCVLAAPFAAVTVVSSGAATYWWIVKPDLFPWQLKEQQGLSTAELVQLDALHLAHRTAAAQNEQALFAVMVAAPGAVAAYAICRAIGWVIAGFTDD